jgi:hypothetical protein
MQPFGKGERCPKPVPSTAVGHFTTVEHSTVKAQLHGNDSTQQSIRVAADSNKGIRSEGLRSWEFCCG